MIFCQQEMSPLRNTGSLHSPFRARHKCDSSSCMHRRQCRKDGIEIYEARYDEYAASWGDVAQSTITNQVLFSCSNECESADKGKYKRAGIDAKHNVPKACDSSSKPQEAEGKK